MPRKPLDYSKTIIYKIVCNDLNITDVYVGHTTSFVKRKWEHKNRCHDEKYDTLKVYQTIRANGNWENWSMVQICEFPCNSLQEARAEERRHYELLNAKLNMINPYREYNEWYEEHKEQKKEYDKNRRITHKTQIFKNYQIWYNENRDRILEKSRETYTCYCGSTLRKSHKKRHEKSIKHIDFIQNLNL